MAGVSGDKSYVITCTMQQQQHHPCLQRLPYNNHLGNVLVRVSPLIYVCDYCNITEGRTCENLHAEYTMIKCPRVKWSIRSEKLLHVDKDNLVSCQGMVNSLVIFVTANHVAKTRTVCLSHEQYM